MTQDELNDIISENRVSTAVFRTNDKLCDLLEEIYYEGYRDGYNHLKGIIERQDPRIFGCHSDSYFEKNMDKIRRRVDAIHEAEGSDDP